MASSTKRTDAESQRIKNYLEELELRNRYMKNDIEFKQSQLKTTKVSQPSKNVNLSAATEEALPVSKSANIVSSIRNKPFGQSNKVTLTELPSQNKKWARQLNHQHAEYGKTPYHLAQGQIDKCPSMWTCPPSPTVVCKSLHSNKLDKDYQSNMLTLNGKYSEGNKGYVPLAGIDKSTSDPVSSNMRKVLLSTSSTVTTNNFLNSWQAPPSRAASNNVNLNDSVTKYKIIKTQSPALTYTRHHSNVSISHLDHIKSTDLKAAYLSNSLGQPTQPHSVLKITTSCDKQMTDYQIQRDNQTSSNIFQKRKILQLRIAAAKKVVSKYHLKRLSPSNKFKTASQLFSHHNSKFKLDKRLCLGGKNRADKSVIGINRRLPHVEINTAAKIISKYKLKRLSPNSTLKSESLLFSSGKVNRALFKFDRRQNNQVQKQLPKDEIHHGSSTQRNSRQKHNAWRQKGSKEKTRLSFHSTSKFSWRKNDGNNQRFNSLQKVQRQDPLNKKHYHRFINGQLYTASSSKLVKTEKNFRFKTYQRQNVLKQNLKLISVRGDHFQVDRAGKSLCRVNKGISNKKDESWDRARMQQMRRISGSNKLDDKTRQAASRAVNRSIAIATAKNKKNNLRAKTHKHCIFFGRFGKCHRGSSCPFVHDPDKVAVCTRFLRGKCEKSSCPFSHNASVHKMPVCLFYLRGSCVKEACPYLHVNVSPEAPVCQDFLSGFCAAGEKCMKLHSHVCPSFTAIGACPRGEGCPMMHRKSRALDAMQGAQSSRIKKSSKNCLSKKKSSEEDQSMFISRASQAQTSFVYLNSTKSQHQNKLDSKEDFKSSSRAVPFSIEPSFMSNSLSLHRESCGSNIKDSVTQVHSKPVHMQASFISLSSADTDEVKVNCDPMSKEFLSTTEALKQSAATSFSDQPSFISLKSKETESSDKMQFEDYSSTKDFIKLQTGKLSSPGKRFTSTSAPIPVQPSFISLSLLSDDVNEEVNNSTSNISNKKLSIERRITPSFMLNSFLAKSKNKPLEKNNTS